MAPGGRPADAGVPIGHVFLGKYRVDSILGHGGMGVVAECTHLALNERVAIKMLRQDVLLDNDAVQRFIREAQAAVKLKSEYVARVSDVGTFENGVPYMVMEFLEGMDLGEVLKERGVLPVPWATELMLQTAEALAEAHSLGIVHRDVKPTNLFVTWRPDGSALIKVLDFGISKSPMGTDMQLTQTQSLLGTPAYMSPEQMRSARLVDSRSDIWSLGTVFYEVIEGRRPFEAESFSEMCVKVAVDPPAPMMNAPPQLQQVILRCLAKTPEHRYASMGDLARDLVPFVADPHSAVVLVERMQRMLRRSNAHDWEGGGTGVGRQSLGSAPKPSPMRSATAQPQWGVGSDPAGKAWHGHSDPAAQPWRMKSDPALAVYQDAASSGVVAPAPPLQTHDTISVRPKSRAWIIVALLVALVGGVVAYAVASATKGSAQSGGPEVRTSGDPATEAPQHVDMPPQVTPGSAALAGSAAVEAPHVETGSGAAKANPPTIDTQSDKANTPTVGKQNDKATGDRNPKGEPKAGGDRNNPKHVIIRNGGGTTKPPGGGTTGATAGSAAKPPGGTGTQKDGGEKPCDPYSSMHGCDSNK